MLLSTAQNERPTTIQKTISTMQNLHTTKIDTDLFLRMVEKNGPNPEDYEPLNKWYDQVWEQVKSNKISRNEIQELFDQLAFLYRTTENLIGFSTCHPHGYPGDFEIIDKIYTHHISEDPKYKKWDAYFHSFSGPRLVRNRKEYFKNILKVLDKKGQPMKILNLASGPCRDILEFFEASPDTKITFDCIEMDEHAIRYAKNLLGDYIKKVNFQQANIFKFKTAKQYDLIWSAGLFDYFNDPIFSNSIARFYQNVKPGGLFIIGNIHPRSTSKAIMELSNWSLNYRTESELIQLAYKSGILDYSKISIEMEPLGMNLFLKIKK